MRYAVVGGGISGLTAAYRLSRLNPNSTVDLFEASSRLGGVLDTKRTDDLLIERGADSFFDKLPWATDLCQELGLLKDLIPTVEGDRRAFILKSDKLHAVPEGFVVVKPQKLMPLLSTPLLSWQGKARLFCEEFIATAHGITDKDYDETVASFAIRRLGQEAFETLVQPLLAGIYTADPFKLSLAATMPDAIEAEKNYGSLRAAIKASQNDSDQEASGARYARFKTLRSGLIQLVNALQNRLGKGCIHLNKGVSKIYKTEDNWFIDCASQNRLGPYQGVVVALPAPRAAEVLQNSYQQLSKKLGTIEYASSAVVTMTFRHNQLKESVSGFGFVVPTVEKRQIVAASFSSQKFPGRAPADQLLIRAFLGGALQPELMEHSDDRLIEIATREIQDLVNISGGPLHSDLVRWNEKMPQYHLGHLTLVREIEALTERIDGLELAGNAYHGVGIPQCIRSGNLAAERLHVLGATN